MICKFTVESDIYTVCSLPPSVEAKDTKETKTKSDKKNSKASKVSTAIIVEAPKDQENTVTVIVAKKEEKKEEKKKEGKKKEEQMEDTGEALDEAKEWYWDYENCCWKECDPGEILSS